MKGKDMRKKLKGMKNKPNEKKRKGNNGGEIFWTKLR